MQACHTWLQLYFCLEDARPPIAVHAVYMCSRTHFKNRKSGAKLLKPSRKIIKNRPREQISGKRSHIFFIRKMCVCNTRRCYKIRDVTRDNRLLIYKKKFFAKKKILVRVVDLVLESMRWEQSRVYYCIIG